MYGETRIGLNECGVCRQLHHWNIPVFSLTPTLLTSASDDL